ncbi:Sialic acid TRAP transporter permease protein SiaT [Pseudodesulfovibrio hydrargyri]|uniref:Sialic acid TRAP transporter permease protein SiaT n=1 Tax=Pseudodesulfovibrio hydrargyri TaxID=2125990 RepID=A0A1J5MXH7_9BACT|nr:TRAP transporter fused permease subunit [Pseudodesulfovibrio hydrargyri]OIQ50524.1 Sialic acid TRAP transporter permease protein SiaT [Pseudodesulfovibrio hydrargyri]
MTDWKENWRKYAVAVVAISVLILQVAAMYFTVVPVMAHRVSFVCLAMILLFLNKSESKTGSAINWLFIVLCLVDMAYVFMEADRIEMRIAFVEDLEPFDYFMGVTFIVMLLEGTRRIAGNVLFGLAAFFIAYGFAGPFLPGVLAHTGFNLTIFLESNTMTLGGVLGTATGAVVNYVFYFLLFTSFLEVSGGGQLFIDTAIWLAGRFRGGTGKAEIVSSSLMGMISGSAVANVVGVGSLTIPIMKENGFDKASAGAITAAAATGGQLMPPIMGAAAFVMAETTNIDYSHIVVAAALPAFFFYFGIFCQVDFYAQKNSLKGQSKEERPDILTSTKRYLHMMVPLGLLVYYIATGKSIMLAGFITTGLLIAISFLRRETWMTPSRILDGIVATVRGLPAITLPCATAGLIISAVIASSLGTKLSALFVTIAGGSIFLSLVAVMIVCIILGMGMPTISAYIIVAMLLVPSLIQLGVPLLAAHMFVFYFALMSFVTPPVALSAYTAAGIAGADASETGWNAFMFTFAGFIVPYVFAYNQGLLMDGSAFSILWVSITCGIGIWVLAGARMGWFLSSATMVERLLGAAFAFCLIIPNMLTDFIGLAGVALVLAFSFKKKRAELQVAV